MFSWHGDELNVSKFDTNNILVASKTKKKVNAFAIRIVFWFIKTIKGVLNNKN